jgi:hypothetical protein
LLWLLPHRPRTRARACLQVLLQLLSSSDEDACTGAAEVLAELLGPGRVGEDPAAEGPVLQMAVGRLVALTPLVQVRRATPSSICCLRHVACCRCSQRSRL